MVPWWESEVLESLIGNPSVHPASNKELQPSPQMVPGPDGSGGGKGQAEAAQVFVVAMERYRGEFTWPPLTLL